MPATSESRIETSTVRRNLALLTRLRWVAIGGQLAAILITDLWLGIDLPVPGMLAVLLFLTSVNLFSYWRLQRPGPIGDRVPQVEILIDVAALTLTLFLSGGAANPFSGLFVLQIIVAATLLPPLDAGPVFFSALAAQLWLLHHGLPLNLPMNHGVTPYAVNLHLQGMFLSFVLTSGLAIWFILGIRDNLRRRDDELAELRRQLEEEAVVLRLGLMASSAAHDLGSPLTNLAVILDDWVSLGLPEPDELRRQAKLMQEAVSTCRESLSCMLHSAGQTRLEEASQRDAADFARSVVARWREGQPELQISVHDLRPAPAPILVDLLLERAVENLLDNAREAGSSEIAVEITSGAGGMAEIAVADNGPGFPQDVLDGAFTPTTEASSARTRGLGLFLVQSVLRRLGGRLELENPASGGARATIRLPALTPA